MGGGRMGRAACAPARRRRRAGQPRNARLLRAERCPRLSVRAAAAYGFLRKTGLEFDRTGCRPASLKRIYPGCKSLKPAISIRRHEDRETEAGEMVQRLIDPDQPPEPLMLLLHPEVGDAKSIGAIDRDVNRKIDQGDEPEPRRDNQDQHR